MITTAIPLTQYAPPATTGTGAQVAVGQAFERFWHDGSEASRSALRLSIELFAHSLRDNAMTPEGSVVAFKHAIRRHGGVHSFPGLALEHNEDGDGCAIAYGEAFNMFVDAYFAGPS